MRTAVKLLACSVGLFTLASTQAAAPTNVVSDPVGFYKVTLKNGANVVGAPLHKVHAYRGIVSGVSGNVVTLNGNPNFSVNQFAPADGYSQYVLIIRNDNSANPGNQGDWWNITANAAGTVTLNPAQGAPASFIAASDQVEIRQKTSMKDLFGTGSSYALIKDSAGDGSVSDVIRTTQNGASLGFAGFIFFHDSGGTVAPTGYYDLNSGAGPLDGSTMTIEPDEPLIVFRRGAQTNIVSLGQVHNKKLTHYVDQPKNWLVSGFPANAKVGSSGLAESGFANDATGDGSNSDVLRGVSTSVGSEQIGLSFFYINHESGGVVAPSGWYDLNLGVGPDSDLPLPDASLAFVYEVKTGTGGRTWRQNVPFTP